MKDLNLGVSVTVTVGSAEVTFEVKKGYSPTEPLKIIDIPKTSGFLEQKGKENQL